MASLSQQLQYHNAKLTAFSGWRNVSTFPNIAQNSPVPIAADLTALWNGVHQHFPNVCWGDPKLERNIILLFLATLAYTQPKPEGAYA